MWNERYSEEGYAYGTAPNTFLEQHVNLLSGPVLSLAEGEGRNAVFLAEMGFEVLGVDASQVGLAKAQKLALARGVSIHTGVVDLAEYVPEDDAYGAVISIFAHLPPPIRKRLYPLVERSLRPGGILLLEAYSKEQIDRDTGGPKDPEMLVSAGDLGKEFSGLEPLLLREVEREVVEGKFHTGLASVVQFIARKKPV